MGGTTARPERRSAAGGTTPAVSLVVMAVLAVIVVDATTAIVSARCDLAEQPAVAGGCDPRSRPGVPARR